MINGDGVVLLFGIFNIIGVVKVMIEVVFSDMMVNFIVEFEFDDVIGIIGFFMNLIVMKMICKIKDVDIYIILVVELFYNGWVEVMI